MDFANGEILIQRLRLIGSGAKLGRRLIAAERLGLVQVLPSAIGGPKLWAKAISRSHTTRISPLAKSISGGGTATPGHLGDSNPRTLVDGRGFVGRASVFISGRNWLGSFRWRRAKELDSSLRSE